MKVINLGEHSSVINAYMAQLRDVNVQGRFVPSAAQTDTALVGITDPKSAYLGVKDGDYVVHYAFYW